MQIKTFFKLVKLNQKFEIIKYYHEQKKNKEKQQQVVELNVKIKNTEDILKNMAMPELLDRGFQPIHIATFWNLQEELDVLLNDKKCDINAQDNLGATPLHIAAVQESNQDMLKYLLDHGSDIDAKNNDGWSPFHYAVRYADSGNIEFLLDQILSQGLTKPCKTETNAGLNALHLAAANPKLDVIQYVWTTMRKDHNNNNNQLKTADKYGFTPVHRASKHGHNHILKFLFTEGFETEPVTQDGFTPLHIAAKNGQLKTVEFLLRNGLSKHSKTKHGHTPLNLAKKHHHHKIVKFLQPSVNKQERKVTFIPESEDDEEDEEIKTTSFEKNMYGEMAQPLYEVLELGFPFIDRFETDYCLIDYINSEAVAMLEEEDVKQREKETLMKVMCSLFIFAGLPIVSVETDILTYLGFYLMKRQLDSVKQD